MKVSDGTGPIQRPAAPKAPATPPAEAKPAVARDGLVLSGGAAPTPAFDLGAAAEGLVAKANGDLEAAYARAINLRNMPKTDPGHAAALVGVSRDAGLGRPITADELRDVEHFLFAAAYTRDFAPSAPGDGYGTRVVKTLAREVGWASAVAATVGYTAAKVANEASKAAFDVPLLKSRTKPSWDELEAGIKGANRGLVD